MQQKTKRLVAGITFGGLGVLMLVIALRSATVSVWANGAATERAQALALHKPSGWSASAVSELMPILQDSYDGTYAGKHTIPRVVGTAGPPFQWGRVIRRGTPFTNTLWCVQGWNGASLVAGTDVYTDGMDTTITYGPLDLRDVVTVSLSFRHWISVADGDGLQWGASVASVPESYLPVTPTLPAAWETTILDSNGTPALAGLLGQNNVYLSFRFHSNDDGLAGQGVFLDDVKLYGVTYTRLHLPLVWGPVPTPTPVVGYEDDFSDASSGFPIAWRRKGSNINIYGGYLISRTNALVWDELMASRAAAGQSLAGPDLEADRARFLAEEEEVYYAVLHDAWDHSFISGPYVAQGDFDLEVRARYTYAQKWYKGNRYGVLLTKEKVNPEDPHSIHGYSFEVEILPKDSGHNFNTAWWRFKEWYRTNWTGDDNGDEDHTMADDPSGAIRSALGDWNTLRIERRGKDFYLYINGSFVRKVHDDANTGPYYVGLIGRHMGSGTTEISYDIMYEWDDLTVMPR